MYEVQIADKQVGFSHRDRREEPTDSMILSLLDVATRERTEFCDRHHTDCPQSHHCSESMTSSPADMPIPKFGRKGLGGVIFH